MPRLLMNSAIYVLGFIFALSCGQKGKHGMNEIAPRSNIDRSAVDNRTFRSTVVRCAGNRVLAGCLVCGPKPKVQEVNPLNNSCPRRIAAHTHSNTSMDCDTLSRFELFPYNTPGVRNADCSYTARLSVGWSVG